MKHTTKTDQVYECADKEWSRGRMRSAFRLFLASAKAGNASAFGTVAQFYDYGCGVKFNENGALYWYRRAYRHGDSTAANNIGCILRDQNKLSLALQWFHRAVKLGDGAANLNSETRERKRRLAALFMSELKLRPPDKQKCAKCTERCRPKWMGGRKKIFCARARVRLTEAERHVIVPV